MPPIFWIALTSSLLAFTAAQAQPCDCPAQFSFLTQKIALNYSGYRDKVNAETRAAFEAHTAHYRMLTATAETDTTCARLMHEWTLFFKDKHVQLGYNAKGEAPEIIRQRYADWEKIPMDEKTALKSAQRPGADPVEGIWEMQGGNYRVAVVPAPTASRDLAAVVLRADSIWWVPGQVKFDLKKSESGYHARFYMRDHSLRELDASIDGNTLQFKGFSNWLRPGAEQAQPNALFTLKQLDTATLLLTVPTMDESSRKELARLVHDNRKSLAQIPYLIIDVRGNGGGSDITYYPLRPYLYTQKVKQDRTQLYATPDNAQKFDMMGKNKDFPWAWRVYGRRTAKKMKRNEGKFIGKKGQATERVRGAKAYPKKVVVLTDGGCGSSCEQFVLFARQSKKTTLMGQPTGGVLDYGNLHFLDFPDTRFRIGYPTSRSIRVEEGRGIDNIGIPPAVMLNEQDGDWVERARQFLRQK